MNVLGNYFAISSGGDKVIAELSHCLAASSNLEQYGLGVRSQLYLLLSAIFMVWSMLPILAFPLISQ